MPQILWEEPSLASPGMSWDKSLPQCGGKEARREEKEVRDRKRSPFR